jgi:hypothetical protein
MVKRKSTAKVQLKVRMQEQLRAKIEADAKKRDASLNDEIVRRLDASFDFEARMAELRTEIETLRERADGGYQELAEEVRELSRAIARGHIDPEDRK